MKTSLDCIPCFLRQALEAARIVSPDDRAFHERIMRESLGWAASMDLGQPPPAMGQHMHRYLRRIAGVADPYRDAKDRQNRMALELAGELRDEIASSANALLLAARLAIAGNVIDLGANGSVHEADIRGAVRQALEQPVVGDEEAFARNVAGALNILYLADNAGEIVFDRLLIERLPPGRVTVAVRGAPVLNDATMSDAITAGIHELAEVIDNGSDAPGTILADCTPDFRRRFEQADVIVAKGQGNYETLSEAPGRIYFLFKAKCPVIAADAGVPLGAHVIAASAVEIGTSTTQRKAPG